MSDQGQQINKSPGGKGGKSLELMQRRLHQTSSQTAPAPAAPAQPSPPAPARQPSPSMGRPKGKDFSAMSAPKGKDFAAMTARAPRAAPAPAPVAKYSSAPAPAPPQQQTATSGKPKGKDFSAMQSKGKDFSSVASRLGGPASAPPPQPAPPAPPQPSRAVPSIPPSSSMSQPNTAQPNSRAAQMQAAARAAAGMPPLDRPTATTVTTVPPNIPPPKISTDTQHRSSGGASAYGSHQRHSNSNYQSSQHQHPPSRQSSASGVNLFPPVDPISRSIHPSLVSTGSSRSSGAPSIPPARRSSKAGQSSMATPTSATSGSHSQSKSGKTTAKTPPPVASESRLSLPQPSAPAAYMAPLVGPRIQDLVKQLDPTYTLDPAAEEQVLMLADDFLDKVCKQAMRVAQHRSSKLVDVQDVQLVLAKQWGIVVPGLGPPVPKKPKVSASAVSARTGVSSTATGVKRKGTFPSSSGPSPKVAKTVKAIAGPVGSNS